MHLRYWISEFGTISAWLLLGVLLLIPIWALSLWWPVMTDPSPGFMDRKGELQQAQITSRWQSEDSVYEELTLLASSGLRAEMTIRRPVQSSGARPLMLMLVGAATGRDAAALLPRTDGFIVAALSYPYYGQRKPGGLALLRDLPPIQQTILDTPPALMLALDYLLQQPEVNANQVELVGISIGAFFVGIPAVLDERVQRLWLVQGAADPVAIFDDRLDKHIGNAWLRRSVARLIGLYSASHYYDPARWVANLPPHKVIVINSHDDEAYPDISVTRLHAALNPPAEIIWLDGGHVSPRRTAIVTQITEAILMRMAQDYQPSPHITQPE